MTRKNNVYPKCMNDANDNNMTSFYVQDLARDYFQGRIEHILTHVNPYFKKAWANLSEVIFSIEVQNEAMGHFVEEFPAFPKAQGWLWCVV